MRLRILNHGPSTGVNNMAIDEALYQSIDLQDPVLTLRVYRFEEPTVTFGYGQQASKAVNTASAARNQIPYIRRLTGGRALLHQHELTYSVSAPTINRSVKKTYRMISDVIGNALSKLGVPIDSTPQNVSFKAPEHLPCLSVSTGHEITINGKKLVASAMRFSRTSFLQHGSILLRIERPLWEDMLPLAPSDPFPCIGLHEVTPSHLSELELVDSLSSEFASMLRERPSFEELTLQECRRIKTLKSKYASSDWNYRKLQ